MTIKNRDIEPIDEFREIGKKLPYREPVDFFERFSDKALNVARQRKKTRERRIMIWRSVAVAASIAVIVFLGYLIPDGENAEKVLVVQDNQPDTIVVLEQKQQIAELPVAESVKKSVAEEADSQSKTDEDMNDILVDLSDEELMQLAAMFKADLFIEEAVQ